MQLVVVGAFYDIFADFNEIYLSPRDENVGAFFRAEARNYVAGRSRNQTNIRGLNLNGSQHKDHSHHIQYPETSGSSLQDLVTTTIRLLINPQPVYRREVQAI